MTCFGYLGYKNARFGRIESHEAVTAYGRECLLRAKEAAEDLGGTVLHMYVDGLWVKKEGARTPEDFRPMLDEIAARTGLPVGLDGIYNWVAFLPSRMDSRLPVANRYFGVFQDGSTKMRGIEVRRRDTPAWIAEAQTELLECLAQAARVEDLPARLPEARRILRRKLADLRAGRVPLARLVVRHGLSRELDAFVTASPAARAAGQLAAVGKQLRPGQSVRFLYTLGEPGVYAWDLPEPPDPRTLDIPRYQELLLRAADTVLQVAGEKEGNAQYLLPAKPFLQERIDPETSGCCSAAIHSVSLYTCSLHACNLCTARYPAFRIQLPDAECFALSHTDPNSFGTSIRRTTKTGWDRVFRPCPSRCFLL